MFPKGLFPEGAFPQADYSPGCFSPRSFFPRGTFPKGTFLKANCQDDNNLCGLHIVHLKVRNFLVHNLQTSEIKNGAKIYSMELQHGRIMFWVEV